MIAMKKASTLIVALLLCAGFKSFAQTAAPVDFFTGKWEISITGTPNGDSKLVTELSRKDGKLSGELKDPSGKMAEVLPITKIEEDGRKMLIYFSTQGMDLGLALEKVDDDHLKGAIMDRFDATAVRIKE